RFLDDVTIHTTLVAGLLEQRQELAHRTVGLRSGKEHVGIEKDAHPPAIIAQISSDGGGTSTLWPAQPRPHRIRGRASHHKSRPATSPPDAAAIPPVSSRQ